MYYDSIRELHILMGLPGAGKTDWARTYKSVKDEGSCWSNVKIVNRTFTWHNASRYMVVDGYFTTISAIQEFVNILYEQIDVEKIVIHRWRDDVEACNWNNRGRNIDENLFNSMMIERPKRKDFNGEVYFDRLSVETHEVIRKPKWKTLPIEDIPQSSFKGDKLMSSSWTVSGCSRDLDGNVNYDYTAEEAVQFTELQNLLLRINQDFPLRYYLEIFSKMISEVETFERDYYSEVYSHHYECDMNNLYDYLVEKGVVEDVV